MMDQGTLADILREDGVLGPDAKVTLLTGGVSSEIVLVRDGQREFVVKSALKKLKVADDWHADPSRNRYEQRFIKYIGGLFPKSVPKILFANEAKGYFGMEYVGEGFLNWKTCLMRGECDVRWASEAMVLLAGIHGKSRGCKNLAAEFDSTSNFHQLRTDPYLLTTANRHPALAEIIREEAARLDATRECLVHGDFSPKNMMIGEDRLVLLDCEVAWFGDPAFDIAFFLNHLCLKALHHAPSNPGLRTLFDTSVETYFREAQLGIGEEALRSLDHRSARLLLMLMLARVDGKSPVEYLGEDAKKNFVRRFVTATLPPFSGSLDELGSLWFGEIRQAFPAS